MLRKAPRIRHFLGSLGLCLLPAFGASPAAAATVDAAPAQDLGELEALARAAAALEFGPLTDRQRLVAGPLQPGLQLAPCVRPVKPLIGPGHHMKDRVTVELRCQGATAQALPAWHLYVPVRVVGTSPVAVAVHAIVAGSVLTTADLRMEQHDISDLPLGFLDDAVIAVGLTAARPIAGGTFMTNQLLVAAKTVQRGQSVTLVADAGGMQVRMAGRALSDGILNQRIKVQNLSSGKVVEGIARSQQVVEIIFQ